MAKGDRIDDLRTRIMEVLLEEPYMGETIPVRYSDRKREKSLHRFSATFEQVVRKDLIKMESTTFAIEIA